MHPRPCSHQLSLGPSSQRVAPGKPKLGGGGGGACWGGVGGGGLQLPLVLNRPLADPGLLGGTHLRQKQGSVKGLWVWGEDLEGRACSHNLYTFGPKPRRTERMKAGSVLALGVEPSTGGRSEIRQAHASNAIGVSLQRWLVVPSRPVASASKERLGTRQYVVRPCWVAPCTITLF